MKRKLIDENGRLFGKVSFIDVFVVLIVIVLGIQVYMRFFRSEDNVTVPATPSVTMENDEFTIKLYVGSVRDVTVEGFRVGDDVHTGATLLGEITKIEVKDAAKEMTKLDGEVVLAPVENRYDITMTLKASGMVTEGGFYAARTFEVCTNNQFTIVSKYCTTTATVLDVYK